MYYLCSSINRKRIRGGLNMLLKEIEIRQLKKKQILEV